MEVLRSWCMTGSGSLILSFKNVNPLFKFFPIGSIISKTNLSPIGLFPEYLPIDIPTIPIKVIATTPVAITFKLIFFSFLFLSNLKDITNF